MVTFPAYADSKFILLGLIILSSNKIQNGNILVPANPGPPGKSPLKLHRVRDALPDTTTYSWADSSTWVNWVTTVTANL